MNFKKKGFMSTVFQIVDEHFRSYDAEVTRDSLAEESPPAPIYTAPINITAILKASVLDAVLYGIPLAVIYSITACCMRTISGSMNPPPLPKYSWKVLLALTPVFVYRYIQLRVGAIIHPAATPGERDKYISEPLKDSRQRVSDEYQAMRVSALSSTRHLVDGVLFKKKDVDLKGRWMIVTPPNAGFYEQLMQPGSEIISLASRLNANILFFNYPGAGRSSGLFPNRDAMVASHQVMVSLLNEVGENPQIVDFGWSIGGGVKWRDHLENPRPKGKHYIVDYQTFRSTSNFGREMLGERGAQGVKFLQWEYDSETTLKASPHPHTVVQAGRDEIQGDGVVTKDNALAQAARRDCVVLSPGGHGEPLPIPAIDAIVRNVEAYFKEG